MSADSTELHTTVAALGRGFLAAADLVSTKLACPKQSPVVHQSHPGGAEGGGVVYLNYMGTCVPACLHVGKACMPVCFLHACCLARMPVCLLTCLLHVCTQHMHRRSRSMICAGFAALLCLCPAAPDLHLHPLRRKGTAVLSRPTGSGRAGRKCLYRGRPYGAGHRSRLLSGDLCQEAEGPADRPASA